MYSRLACILSGCLLLGFSAQASTTVTLQTNMGPIVLELDESAAPITVENFLGYVRRGDYGGTIFHRVIPGFMIQGGGFSPDFERQSTAPPIDNEADNGLQNERGTVAMARTGDPHSATNQFFINLVDNDFLDHRDKSPSGWGYCVFGRVTEGMEVVDAIADLATGPAGPFREDVPQQTVIIEQASVSD